MSLARSLSLSEAISWRDQLEAEGRKLVFTSGCFDILHAGHVRYLAEARKLGDALLVALNSDDSVRRLKGPHRPVNSEEDRAEVLLGLESVDAVIVFSEARTSGLICAIRPHLFAKGGDYTLNSLNPDERTELEAAGSQIHLLPVVPGRSTTATLERMALPEKAPPRVPRIGVLGSGNGSNFGAVLEAIDSGILAAEIALVLSDNANAGILDRARNRGIAAEWVDPGDHPNRFSPAAQQAVADRFVEAGCDLILCAGFMRRLKDPLLSCFASRILNIHPSLLPEFPGREAWKQALEAGVSETGCTVHLVDAGIDTGPILAQARVLVEPADTPDSLQKKIQMAEHELLPRVIQGYLDQIGLRS